MLEHLEQTLTDMAEMVNKFKLWDGLGGSGAGHLTGPYVPSLTSLSDATPF
ncbi:hypothetical protein QCA50_019678 [Cerrena zonata]|uniref:Uncharacterized protein n=1 Tax=Cerrena zonata TaxID=2478898 RepID=A0AAW0F930_9APHY